LPACTSSSSISPLPSFPILGSTRGGREAEAC
jgi:hypothetical protein